MNFQSIKAKVIKHKKWIIAGYVLKLLVTLAIVGFAQEPVKKKTEEIQIKTSLMCKMCKERITNGLIYEKGIKDVSIDIPSKIVTVKYNTKQTNPDKIRTSISKMGYDADKVAGDPKAYEKLPPCCKKDAPTHE
jgi:copper chaperone CopZ